MMEIEFSVMERVAGESNMLLPLLAEFERQYRVHVKIIPLTWDKGWNEIVKYGIYGHGPDVSTIGSSWIGSLASMRALRPFNPQEIRALGGSDAYFDSIWQSGMLVDNPTPWAIPWFGDARMLFYWKDELKKAGIENFDEAFKTDMALIQTLETLKKNGYQYPFAITTHTSHQALHEAAHWVWTAGGDFVSPDGKQVIFNQPKALAGFKNYFGMLPYINPASLTMTSTAFFEDKTSPLYISGIWVTSDNTCAVSNGQLGVAKLPGIAYVGGTSFAIWQYTSKYQQAFDLIRFLSARPLVYNNDKAQYYKLPTKRESLDAPMTQNDPFNHIYMDSFQSGKSFPSLRLWGLIEDKLMSQIVSIWTELFADPDQDLDACLHKHLDPLAERLNMALGN